MAWRQIGYKGDRRNTIAAAAMDSRVYTVEASGKLYVTGLDGNPQLLGTGYANVKHLMASNGKLYVIDTNGTLFEVDIEPARSAPPAPAAPEPPPSTSI